MHFIHIQTHKTKTHYDAFLQKYKPFPFLNKRSETFNIRTKWQTLKKKDLMDRRIHPNVDNRNKRWADIYQINSDWHVAYFSTVLFKCYYAVPPAVHFLYFFVTLRGNLKKRKKKKSTEIKFVLAILNF